jgi:hypothetical protein
MGAARWHPRVLRALEAKTREIYFLADRHRYHVEKSADHRFFARPSIPVSEFPPIADLISPLNKVCI